MHPEIALLPDERICAVGERVPRAFIKGGKIVSVRDNVYDADIKETL